MPCATLLAKSEPEPEEGCIDFVTSIPGAKIYVDNVDTGKVTPSSICGLSPGTHTYRLELSGYVSVTGSVDLGAGERVLVSIVLTPVKKGIGAGTILGVTVLSIGILGAVLFSTREKKQGG